ncbi:MAG: aldose epimerase family protein [Bacteroidota bacterium]
MKNVSFPIRMNLSRIVPVLLASFLALTGCNQATKKSSAESPALPPITVKPFGVMPDGQAVSLYTLENAEHMVATITNYGGTLTSLLVPDRDGKMGNIILGFDTLTGYLEPSNPYFGCLVGRYANRIAKGSFELDGKKYQLNLNDGSNTLHGGFKGFDKLVWNAEIISADGRQALQLTLHSPDGDEGYPGNMDVTVVYEWIGNKLSITYQAVCDQPTPVNLTNHAYFNLAGEGTILDHVLTIPASHYTPVDATLIPTGEVATVEGTPFDFREAHVIGERIAEVEGGYDHNFVLDKTAEGKMETASKLVDPKSGRVVEISTTEPAIQFYSGNFLKGDIVSRGWSYIKHTALCLETQHYPDSPNQPSFPNTILRPGETFTSQTLIGFSTEK